jgi:hypothetical protein
VGCRGEFGESHGIAIQKTPFFIVTAVRTSSLTGIKVDIF